MSNQPPPPPPSGPAGMPPPPGGSPSVAGADVGIRIGARIIDSIILGIIGAILLSPLVFSTIFADAQSGGMVSALGAGGWSVAGFVYSLLALVIGLAYYALFDSRMGGTPGKKILGMSVRGPGGGNPTVEESVRRNAWLALNVIPVIGGLLQLGAAIYILVTVSQSDANVGWHDTFAGGTRVVRG